MALYYDLPVFKEVYQLILKIFEYTKDFPKDYKYTLGQDMKRDGIQLVRSIYRANIAKDKKEYLEQLLDDFEVLKLEIRLCVDMKILSIKKQAELSQMMESKSLTSGTTPCEMLYWNGTAWVSVAPGNQGQILSFLNGVPTWWPNTVGLTDANNPVTGKVWMDRNLGATRVATSSIDALSYGDLYQWGRDSDGHQIRTLGTTTTLSVSDIPGHGDFILTSSSPYDWRSGQNDNLWQGVNGTNNPCPAGYRLPTDVEWDDERMSRSYCFAP